MSGESSSRRYPGAAPFSDSPLQRKLFFGRNADAKNLSDTVLAESLVVVYAKSGTGKTSLINVELKERLRAQGYAPLVVRVDKRDRGPLATIYDGIRQSAEDQGFEHHAGSQVSLWHYFKTNELWKHDVLLKPALIIDQFEELFTLHDASGRQGLTSELAHLLRGPAPQIDPTLQSPELTNLTDTKPAVKVVLSMREDFLADLDDLAVALPNILATRYRVGPLDRDQAREAITTPATVADARLDTPQFTYATGVVERVLDFLASGASSARSESRSIEAFQVQIVCQHVEDLVRSRTAAGEPGPIAINFEDLGGDEGLRRIVRDFYERQLIGLPRGARRRVERLCELGLASRDGRRLSQEQAEIRRRFGVDAELLATLVDRRLLRSEPRLGGYHYELSHDTLLIPVLRAREARAKRQKKQFAAAALGVALVPAIVGGVHWYRESQQAVASRFLKSLDQTVETDSEGRLILAVAAVRATLDASHTDAGTLQALSTAEERETTTSARLAPDVTEAVLSPGGQLVATATASGRIELDDLAGRTFQVLDAGPTDKALKLGFSADGTRIAAAGSSVRIWDITGRKLAELPMPRSPDDSRLATSIALAPESNAVAVADATGWSLLKLDGTSQRADPIPPTYARAVLSKLTFSPDGSNVFGTAANATVYVWTAAGRFLTALYTDVGIRQWAATGDAQHVAAIVGDHVRLLDGARAQDLVLTPYAQRSADSSSRAPVVPIAVSFSPDGRRLAVSTSEGSVDVFDLSTRDPKRSGHLPVGDSSNGLVSVSWSSDGLQLMAEKHGDMGNTLFVLQLDDSARSSPGGESAASGGATSPARQDSSDARTTTSIPDLPDMAGAFLLDQNRVVVGAREGLYLLTASPSSRHPRPKRLTEDPVTAVVPVGSDRRRFLVQTVTGLKLFTPGGTAQGPTWHRGIAGAGSGGIGLAFEAFIQAATLGPAGLSVVMIEDGHLSLWSGAAGGGELKQIATHGIEIQRAVSSVVAQDKGGFLVMDSTGAVYTLSSEGMVSGAGRLLDVVPSLAFDYAGQLVTWSPAAPPVLWGRPTASSGSGWAETISKNLELDRDARGISVRVLASLPSANLFAALDDHGDLHVLRDANHSDTLNQGALLATHVQDVQQLIVSSPEGEFALISKGVAPKDPYTVLHVQSHTRLQDMDGLDADLISVGNRGQFIATLDRASTSLRLFDTELRGFTDYVTDLEERCHPSAIAASPVDDRLIVGCTEGLLAALGSTGVELPHPEPILDFEKRACNTGSDGQRSSSNKELDRQNAISALAFAPTGRFFAGVSARHKLAIWRADGSKLVDPLTLDTEISAIAVSADDMVAASSIDGKVLLWKLEGTRLRALASVLPLHEMSDTPTALQFSPDSQWLLIGFKSGALRLLDRKNEAWLIRELRMDSRRSKNEPIVNVAFSPDGREFAAGSSQGEVEIWSDRGDPLTATIPIGTSTKPVGVGFTGDGRHLVTSLGLPISDSVSSSTAEWITEACDRLRFSTRLGKASAAADGDNRVRKVCATSLSPWTQPSAPRSRSALAIDAARGRIAGVKGGLDAGVDVNATDEEGRTPLMWALGGGHSDVASLLLARGADPMRRDSAGATTLLYASNGGALAVVPDLIRRGVAVDDRDASGRTPLMNAAGRGNIALMALLLDAHASPDLADRFGHTALMKAAEANRASAVDLLLRAKADPNRRDAVSAVFGETAVQLARRGGAPKVIVRLQQEPLIVRELNIEDAVVRLTFDEVSATPSQRDVAAKLAAWTNGRLGDPDPKVVPDAKTLLTQLEAHVNNVAPRPADPGGPQAGFAPGQIWSLEFGTQTHYAGKLIVGDARGQGRFTGHLDVSYTSDGHDKIVREAAEIIISGNKVRINCSDPKVLKGVGGYNADSFIFALSSPEGGSGTTSDKGHNGDPAVLLRAAPTNAALPAVVNGDTRHTTASAAELDEQLLVGLAHAVGFGGGPDWTKALEDFRAAAERGSGLAKALYGVLISAGIGAPQDVYAGTALLRTAAQDGDSFAAWYLGLLYRDGIGVEESKPEARKWFESAKDFGPALNSVSFEYIDRIERTPEELTSECAAKVSKNLTTAANLGDPMAALNLASWTWYSRAPGVQGFERAVSLGESVIGIATSGTSRPQIVPTTKLGVAYLYGAGAQRDTALALKWLKLGADWGNPEASRELARMYEQGIGVAKSYAKALMYYREAAAGGDYFSLHHLTSLGYVP